MKKILAAGVIFAILVIPLINAITPMAEADTNNVALTDMAILTALGLGGVALNAGQDGIAMTAQNAIDDIRANAPGVVSAIQSSINEANNTMILSATGVWAVLANYIGASYDVGQQTRDTTISEEIQKTFVNTGSGSIVGGITMDIYVGSPYPEWKYQSVNGIDVKIQNFMYYSSVYENTVVKSQVCTTNSAGDVIINYVVDQYSPASTYWRTVGGQSGVYKISNGQPLKASDLTAYNWLELQDIPINYSYSGAPATAVDQGAEFDLGGNISADSGVVVTIPQSIDELQGLTWQQILEQHQVIEADNAQAWADARIAEIDVVDGRLFPWPLPIDWPIGYTGEWSIPQTISADGTITADSTIGLTLTGAQTIAVSTTVTATGVIDPPIEGEINWDKLKMTGLLFTNKFPFSLPWDLFESFNSFNTGPGSDDHQVFTFDLSNTPLQQSFSVNMEWFEEYIPIIKMVELAIFDIGLILGTRKLLGGDA